MIDTLNNNHLIISFNLEEKQISCKDKDDTNNYPCFYTTKKRPVKKTWEIIKSKFNEDITFNQISRLVADYCQIHQYCSMD